MIGIIFLIILAGVIFYFVTVYNRFQKLKNGADATLGQVKVALKKRLDMLSQLVDNIKSYASFEKSTFEKITELRSSVLKTNNPDDLNKIEKESKNILGNLLFTVENYPELKTSEIVKELTSSIQEIEDEIARHRYTYNNIVQEYNTMIDTIPSNIIANISHFSKKDYLKFEEDINKTPELEWKT